MPISNNMHSFILCLNYHHWNFLNVLSDLNFTLILLKQIIDSSTNVCLLKNRILLYHREVYLLFKNGFELPAKFPPPHKNLSLISGAILGWISAWTSAFPAFEMKVPLVKIFSHFFVGLFPRWMWKVEFIWGA